MTKKTGVHGNRLLLFLSLLSLSLGACGEPSETIGSDVVVSIAGDDVQYERFESYLRDNVDSSDLPLPTEVLDQLFDQFLDEQLLVRLAQERGLEGEEPVSTGKMVDQRRAVAYLLRGAEINADFDTEVVAYYEAHRHEYLRSEGVRLEQILVYERAEATRAEVAIKAGEDFDQVAARFSQVPSVQLGDQGRLGHEDLPEAFADAVFALQPGEVSEIFAAEYGFHIFQVVARFPAEEVPLEDVTEEIRRIVENRHFDELVASFLAEAQGRYDLRIHPSNFPFEYQGQYADENF